ncbi:MAG: hypothetical protein ACI88A_000990 [Paraglaciecola sp.]|jgi:hypothetical protein
MKGIDQKAVAHLHKKERAIRLEWLSACLAALLTTSREISAIKSLDLTNIRQPLFRQLLIDCFDMLSKNTLQCLFLYLPLLS